VTTEVTTQTADDTADSEASTTYTSESTPDTGSAGSATSATVVNVAPAGATGRRKEAVARVRITPGTGQWVINGRTLQQYFPNKVHQQLVNEPFVILDQNGAYDVFARMHGGGTSGQAGALRLGIARALNSVDEENNRPRLKKAGFLTRDARAVERKKAGLKKARKAPQYSKR